MIDLAIAGPPIKRRNTGNLFLRGLNHVVRGLIPFDLDPSLALSDPAADAGHTARSVEIPIGNHFTPGILLIPKEPSGGTLVFVHGTAAEKLLPYYFYVREFVAAGLKVLFFELDGHGRNPRALRCPGIDEAVPAAYRFLLEQPEVDPARVGMIGMSLGGACILKAMADLEGVRAIATLSTPARVDMDEWDKLKEALGIFNPEMLPTLLESTPKSLLEFVTAPMRIALDGDELVVDLLDPVVLPSLRRVIAYLDPPASAARMDVPLLVVNGAWDHQSPAWGAQEIYDNARGPKVLFIVPRRNHFTLMASRQAIQRTVDWFLKWL